jgi:hypothetical protein
MLDSENIHDRIMQLEASDRKLQQEVGSLHTRLDTALITLTHNVNSLTDAIRALQESQSQTTALQHSMILLTERASVVPKMQDEINSLVISRATDNVVLKAIRFLASALVVAVITAAAAIITQTQ